ncbi:type III restriction enzyme [Xylariaceae sp. FL0016]|nr:type III restriction enzyme [Xylariaceae sp. FL0016]
MDSDEFDDGDIADEDLIIAATQVTTTPNRNHSSAKFNAGRFQARVEKIPVAANGLNSRPTGSVPRFRLNATIDLDDLPPHAFSSSPATNQPALTQRTISSSSHLASRVGRPVTAYRQTTLFGQAAQSSQNPEAVQPNRNRAFRVDLPPEAPTHHDLDIEAMKTWVYPTNLGPTRDYQFSIVKNGLFNNTLVALPTGLGKTFIAATIMLNYFRWMKTAKIIFVAPTKPLVAQQVDACFHVTGIPRSDTTLLTGETSPALRAEEWKSKRVFFMTPQTLENDLSHGYADPKSIGLLVVDEAHRATGNYAYVKVVTFLRRFSKSFRILALTATPGSKVEAVQEVIDGLGISHIEIRTEESIDIRQYVHQRDEDIIVLDPSDEMHHIKELFSKALKPLVEKLSSQNIFYGRDPMALTTYGLIKAKQEWFTRAGHSANQGVKFMMQAVFTVLGSLAHSIKLLNFHGIRPFYHNLVQFREEAEAKGQKGPKYKKQIVEDESFQEMMTKIESWSRKDGFVSHPKLTCLSDTVLNHFMDAGEGTENGPSSNTRIIVFSEYRDSAEDIVKTLNTHKPMIRAAVFVGQADSKRSEGMKQAEQIERIKKFKNGDFNVLVATSIGEEGLDIGQVDLIICYDASASPIRMLQRMGRTGRKRAGRVVLLLMRGKEEDKYMQSKDGYEKMQAMICDGSRFNFRHDLSTRIVPREIRPEADMRAVEIPIENTQISGLPEPKKGRAKSKKPPKKFHMPDDVQTGFTSVASMLGRTPTRTKTQVSKEPLEQDDVVDIPELSRVLLLDSQTSELHKMYANLPYQHQDAMEFIEQVDVTAHPAAQRMRQKTSHVKHGYYTKRFVRLVQTLAKSQLVEDRYTEPYEAFERTAYRRLPLPSYGSDTEDELPESAPAHKQDKPTTVSIEEDFLSDVSDLVEISAAVSRTMASKPKSRASVPKAAPRKQQASARTAVFQDDDEDEDLPPPPRKRGPKPKQAPRKAPAQKAPRGRPKKKATAAFYDESADEGDDCRRTSDLELSHDSDDGSDLVGFVVGDDVATSSALVTSSLRRRSTSPTSLPPSSPATINERRVSKQPYYMPTNYNNTQESIDDGEVPSMSQIVRDSASKGPARRREVVVDDEDEDDEDDEPVQIPRGRAKKKRKVILDDDEDSDDG